MFIRVILKSTTPVLLAHHVYRGEALLPRNHSPWCSTTNQTVPQHGIKGMSANGRETRLWCLCQPITWNEKRIPSLIVWGGVVLFIPWWDTKLLVKDLKGQGPLIKGLPWTPPSPHNLCSDQFMALKSNQSPTQSFSLLCHWKPKEKPPLLFHVL